jgi:hypothetical protein
MIGQTKEPNTIRSCVIKAKWENVRYYLHIWPICHIYDVYYIYFNIIYGIMVMVISIILDYRNGMV